MNSLFFAIPVVLSGGKPQLSFRQLDQQSKCVSECPTPADLGEYLARIASYASTSTTQWAFGSTGPAAL